MPQINNETARGSLSIYNAVLTCPRCDHEETHEAIIFDLNTPKIERCNNCKSYFVVIMNAAIVLETGIINYQEKKRH